MAFDISRLKSISAGSLAAITKKEQPKRYEDTRFWKIERDQKTGIGQAVIRFLPSLKEGELPWVERWTYFIRTDRGVYSEVSLRTIGQPDPMGEYISKRWKEAVTDHDKEQLKKAGLSSPRKEFIANVLIVNDVAHPENNGKVKLFKFGQQIYDKIIRKAEAPAFEGAEGNVNVTDWINGADFHLYIYTKDKYPTYERSEFMSCKPIGDDQKILDIANAMYDLQEFVDPEKLKDRATLEARINYLFNGETKPATVQYHQAVAQTTQSQNGFGVQEMHLQPTNPNMMFGNANESVVSQQPTTSSVADVVQQSKAPWEDDGSVDYFQKLMDSAS